MFRSFDNWQSYQSLNEYLHSEQAIIDMGCDRVGIMLKRKLELMAYVDERLWEKLPLFIHICKQFGDRLEAMWNEIQNAIWDYDSEQIKSKCELAATWYYTFESCMQPSSQPEGRC